MRQNTLSTKVRRSQEQRKRSFRTSLVLLTIYTQKTKAYGTGASLQLAPNCLLLWHPKRHALLLLYASLPVYSKAIYRCFCGSLSLAV